MNVVLFEQLAQVVAGQSGGLRALADIAGELVDQALEVDRLEVVEQRLLRVFELEVDVDRVAQVAIATGVSALNGN